VNGRYGTDLVKLFQASALKRCLASYRATAFDVKIQYAAAKKMIPKRSTHYTRQTADKNSIAQFQGRRKRERPYDI
jgi:hypothetical protein